jgi:hypothetical protein
VRRDRLLLLHPASVDALFGQAAFSVGLNASTHPRKAAIRAAFPRCLPVVVALQ